jgi:chromosome segregation ATPase
MLMNVFGTEKDRWDARVAHANSALEQANVQRTEKMNAKDEADAELKIQKDVVRERVEAQSKASEVVEECQQELAAALTQRENVEAAKGKLVTSQEHDLAFREIVKGLKEGIYENPKELKKHIMAASVFFEGLGAEEALVKTLPQLLRSKPSERGSFDGIALQQLDSYMDSHLSSLTSKIETAHASVTEHTEATTAWNAVVEVSQEKKRESEEALQAAEAHQEQLQEALKCARKVLKEYTAVVKSRDADVTTEQGGLHKAEEVLEALRFLQEFVVPAPAEEAKEPEEVVAEPKEPHTASGAENLMDKGHACDTKISATAKSQKIDVQMIFEDMPSPSKHARRSLGDDSQMVVA